MFPYDLHHSTTGFCNCKSCHDARHSADKIVIDRDSLEVLLRCYFSLPLIQVKAIVDKHLPFIEKPSGMFQMMTFAARVHEGEYQFDPNNGKFFRMMKDYL